ncbi:MAG: DUF2079 domain-containing protein [Labilithrix sp.]|nr:DUF2079 domain-containing protein [Labilithrix sp.]
MVGRRWAEGARPWVTRDALLAVSRIMLGAYSISTFGFFFAAGPTATTRAILHNALFDSEQRALSLAIAASLAAAASYAALLASRAKRRGGDPVAAVVARSYEPLIFTPLAFWPLYQVVPHAHVDLVAIAAMAASLGLALHLMGTRSPRAARLDALERPALDRVGGLIAATLALLHGAATARSAVANFDVLFSGWDLAIYSQVHWNITTTGVPWSSAYSDATTNHYGIHFSPIYHLTSLLYALRRSPTTLLVLENVAIALGALPLYGLARRLTGKASVALMLVGGYVLNPCTQALGTYDFHEIVFFVPLMLALAWAVEVERPRLVWVVVALVLMIREDTPAYLLVYAAYLWLTDRRKIAIRVGAAAAIYIVLVHAMVMPALRSGDDYVFDDRYADLYRVGSKGKASVIGTLLTNPAYVLGYLMSVADKWEFVALVLLPVIALPLVSRRAVLLLVPGFAFSLLSSFRPQYSIAFHYTAPTLPFLYVATLVAIARFPPRTRLALAAATLLSTCLLAAKHGRSPWLNAEVVRSEAAWRAAIYGERAPLIHAALAKIPKEARVRATGNLLPHVAERLHAYIIPHGRDSEYTVNDYRPEGRNGVWYPRERAYLLELLRSRTYGVYYGDDAVLVLGKGLSTDRNAEFIARLEALPEK